MKLITGLAAATLILATGIAEARDNPTVAPPSAGPNGPLSSADRNGDGTVTRAEIEDFMRDGPYRRYGFVEYFDMLDVDGDGNLNAAERANAEPPGAMDDVDFDGNGLVSRAEAQQQVGDRLYREIGVEKYFVLLDLNSDDRLTPDEIQAAKDKGQLVEEGPPK